MGGGCETGQGQKIRQREITQTWFKSENTPHESEIKAKRSSSQTCIIKNKQTFEALFNTPCEEMQEQRTAGETKQLYLKGGINKRRQNAHV